MRLLAGSFCSSARSVVPTPLATNSRDAGKLGLYQGSSFGGISKGQHCFVTAMSCCPCLEGMLSTRVTWLQGTWIAWGPKSISNAYETKRGATPQSNPLPSKLALNLSSISGAHLATHGCHLLRGMPCMRQTEPFWALSLGMRTVKHTFAAQRKCQNQ